MTSANPINRVPFGHEKTREEFLARAAWEYDQASSLRGTRPVGYVALAEAHERAAKKYERAAESQPSEAMGTRAEQRPHPGRARTHATIAAPPTKIKRVAKTKLVHVVQGNYGYGNGWEDLTAEDDVDEARARLREYRANEPGGAFRRIRRRERIEAVPATAHARKKKLEPREARQRLEAAGIDFSRDSDELSMSDKQLVADTARAAGYRKRKDAPGSTARMYFQYLSRLR